MTGGEQDEPERSRWRSAIEPVVILAVAVSGMITSDGALLVVGCSAVALLYLADRGQHRQLITSATHLPAAAVASLSIGAHLLNNLVFCLLAFCAGRLTTLIWLAPGGWHALDWSAIAQWSAVSLGTILFMLLAWRLLERGGR